MKALQGAAQKQLRQFVERIERLEQERKDIIGDIADVYAEAKAVGFDVPTMRNLIKVRKIGDMDREEQFSLLGVYMHALGMKGLPLGDWADEQDMAGTRLSEMAVEDGAQTTISINGGPEVPLATALEAVKLVKRRKRDAGQVSPIAALDEAIKQHQAKEVA
jgi:uncharacterized protein (UPF0335 family)